MVRRAVSTQRSAAGSPHPRGDGPISVVVLRSVGQFSPPAWGWSANAVGGRHRAIVLPTRVGMVRRRSPAPWPRAGSPHPRGDGPITAYDPSTDHPFSPPAWGWSDPTRHRCSPDRVLPTRVGMVRCSNSKQERGFRSPHPRGDGPAHHPGRLPTLLFSPPAWGWSGGSASCKRPHAVLPTRVGMVRASWVSRNKSPGSPHPRGDGPLARVTADSTSWFSPPAWGWSVPSPTWTRWTDVLPTRVGMVRQLVLVCVSGHGSPHPRGDGPTRVVIANLRAGFSPPAWGWSADAKAAELLAAVLPTRVGMVRDSPPAA